MSPEDQIYFEEITLQEKTKEDRELYDSLEVSKSRTSETGLAAEAEQSLEQELN